MRCLLVAVVVAAASSCSPCPQRQCLSLGAVVVRVFDADTHAPINSATVLASSGESSPSEVPVCADGEVTDAGPSTNCRAIQDTGAYHITVRASGYIETSLDVEASRDACGHLTAQYRDVNLQRLGVAKQPMVTATEVCGG